MGKYFIGKGVQLLTEETENKIRIYKLGLLQPEFGHMPCISGNAFTFLLAEEGEIQCQINQEKVDLEAVGKRILLDLLNEKGYDIESVYQDCGLLIFDGETQDTHSGGSGCGCSASVLAAYILPELAKGTWKRVLFVPTGALLSKTSFNEGDSIPGIAHAVVLEHVSKKDQKQ